MSRLNSVIVWWCHETCFLLSPSQYQLQWTSPWRSVSLQWQTWLVLITAFVLVGLVPYVVYCMMTAFTNPPPPTTFKVAAASFGLLSEILLIKWVFYFYLLTFISVNFLVFNVLLVWTLDNMPNTVRILIIKIIIMVFSVLLSRLRRVFICQIQTVFSSNMSFLCGFQNKKRKCPCHPNNHLWKHAVVRPKTAPHHSCFHLVFFPILILLIGIMPAVL